MKSAPKFLLALTVVFFINIFNVAFAAQVSAVKGKQVLVQGDQLEVNGLYFVVSQGKKKGIIKIKQLKGNKALALLLKGSADKGYNLVYRPRKKAGSTATNTASKPAPQTSSKGYDRYSETPKSNFNNKTSYRSSSTPGFYSLGGMLAFQQNSASVEIGNGTDSLSGSGIGFKAFGDYMLNERIHLRGEFGTVAFQAEGTDMCFGATCVMNINYLGATIWGRYMLGSSDSKTRFWGGAGASLIFPMGTGDTNAVNVDDIGSTMIFNVGGGFDYRINDKYFIPFHVEYALFPPSDQVSANMILVKAGLGMRL